MKSTRSIVSMGREEYVSVMNGENILLHLRNGHYLMDIETT